MWSSCQIRLLSFCSCLVQCSLILTIPHPILCKKFRYKPVTCRGQDLILCVVSEIFYDDNCVAVVVLTNLAPEGLWQSVCCQLVGYCRTFDGYVSEVVLRWSRVCSLVVLKLSFCSYLKRMHNGEHEYVWVISWTFTRAFSIVIIFQTNTVFWKLPAAETYCLFWILWQWKSPCEYWRYYSSKTIVKNSYVTVRCLSYHMCYQQ